MLQNKLRSVLVEKLLLSKALYCKIKNTLLLLFFSIYRKTAVWQAFSLFSEPLMARSRLSAPPLCWSCTDSGTCITSVCCTSTPRIPTRRPRSSRFGAAPSTALSTSSGCSRPAWCRSGGNRSAVCGRVEVLQQPW